MRQFSLSWKSSTKPKKQRKYLYNAPLHIRHKLVAAHLSEELRQKHGLRSIPLRKADMVKVMRGSFTGRSGKVERVDLKRLKVFIEGIDVVRKDGSKSLVPLDPSNLLVQSISIDDRMRKKKIGRLVKNG